MGTPIDELIEMEWQLEDETDKSMKLTRADLRLLKNMHAWIIWEELNHPGVDYTTLEMDDFDNFLLVRSQATVTMAPPTLTAPLQVQIPSTPIQSQYMSPATLMPNVKLDVKQYPTFNGDGSILDEVQERCIVYFIHTWFG